MMVVGRSLAAMYRSILLTALCMAYCAAVASAQRQEQSGPRITTAADHCASHSTFSSWRDAAAQGLAGVTGFGLGLQIMLSLSSVALMGFSLGCMWYALRVEQHTEKTLSELTAAAAALQEAAAGTGGADRLSSILMKLDLAAEATTAAAAAITDAMLGDDQKGERHVVTAPTKKAPQAKPEPDPKTLTPIMESAAHPRVTSTIQAKPCADTGDLISLEPSDTKKMEDKEMKGMLHMEKVSDIDVASLPFKPLTALSDEEDFPDATASSSIADHLKPSPLVTLPEPNTPGVATPAAAAAGGVGGEVMTPSTGESILFSPKHDHKLARDQTATPRNTPIVKPMGPAMGASASTAEAAAP